MVVIAKFVLYFTKRKRFLIQLEKNFFFFFLKKSKLQGQMEKMQELEQNSKYKGTGWRPWEGPAKRASWEAALGGEATAAAAAGRGRKPWHRACAALPTTDSPDSNQSRCPDSRAKLALPRRFTAQVGVGTLAALGSSKRPTRRHTDLRS